LKIVSNLDEVFEKYGPICCEVTDRVYTCHSCNHPWRVQDFEHFYYYKPFAPDHFLVKAGIAREGDPMCLRFAEPRADSYHEPSTWFSAGHQALGWFARCIDQEQCARYRANNHAGLHYEQTALT
jgi:hypothetical protein